jgi:hypothetical protein
MSTKTTFKRIALVAVASLGFGVLTSVAPATAAGQTAESISIGAATSFKTGVFNIIPVTVAFPAGFTASSDTITITAQIASAPSTGGLANAASVLGTGSTTASNHSTPRLHLTTSAIGTINSNLTTATSATATVDADYTIIGQRTSSSGLDDIAGDVAATAIQTTAPATGTTKTVYLAVKPDLSGSYSILVATNATGRSYYSAGDPTATATFATTSTVASVTLTALNTAPVGTGSNDGVIIKAVLKDSAGNVTGLGSLDTLKFTGSDTTNNSFQYFNGATGTDMTGDTATQGMFINGTGYFRVKNAGSADAVNTITVTGSGLLPSSVVSTVSATFKALGDEGATAANTLTGSISSTITSGYAGTFPAVYRSTTATSTSVKYSFAAAAAAAGAVGFTITDTSQKILGSGTPGVLVWRQAVSYAAAATSVSLTVSHSALSTSGSSRFTIATDAASDTVLGQAANNTVTVTGYTAGTTGTNTFSVNPAGPVANAAAGKVTVVATLKDQFSTAIANGAVTATVTGRNTVAATPLVTNADGQVTFSYTDAGTSTANDTITFASSVGTTTSKTVTVTYGNAAVSTVAVTSSNTTLGVANATVTPLAISAGDGAEAGAVNVTATVKDANGNLLPGVAVTWTISGTGAAVTTTTATSYTTSAGVATASVFAWLAGTYTVTATAGGKSGTGTTTWSSQTAGNARVLSATVEGNVVTAKVVDRFGNPVKNVLVYATKSGVGYFGTGYGTTSGTTLADGTTQFNIIGGNASVTVTTLDPTSAAGTNPANQTCALAGNLTCASGATAAVAFTASVAGDALNDAEYVGASYAPAGVNSATVEVTDAASSAATAAADAAAEATDAANAATDAANAAAEAADAATAAAQDAADAVAALSTQVSEMVNALKKQITALTNLVIKIQKKVKA